LISGSTVSPLPGRCACNRFHALLPWGCATFFRRRILARDWRASSIMFHNNTTVAGKRTDNNRRALFLGGLGARTAMPRIAIDTIIANAAAERNNTTTGQPSRASRFIEAVCQLPERNAEEL
jgi:hypothetical protein